MNNLQNYKWQLNDKEIIRNIFTHTIYTYLSTFIEHGFTNGKLCFENILLYNNDENYKDIEYKIYTYIIQIPIKKFIIRIINFEKSKLNYDFNELYKDIINFLSNISEHDVFNKIFNIKTLSLLNNNCNNLLEKYNKEIIKNKELSIKYAILLLDVITNDKNHNDSLIKFL